MMQAVLLGSMQQWQYGPCILPSLFPQIACEQIWNQMQMERFEPKELWKCCNLVEEAISILLTIERDDVQGDLLNIASILL
jgi:hypothetical protein